LRYDRRQLLLLVAGAALACARREAPQPSDLGTLLGLDENQRHWLEALSEAEREELAAALAAGGATAASPRSVALLMKVVGRRSRLFAYVGYPEMDDEPDLCDGLVKA
jgi:hypothetical protein